MQVFVPDCVKAEEWIRYQTRHDGRDCLSGFRILVGISGREGKFARLERLAAPACWGIIGASVLYFVPVCLRLLIG